MKTLSPVQLQEELAHILTGGVDYYELADSFLNDGQMTPDFAARYASDVVEEIDNIVELFASQRQAILKEVREGFYHKIRCTTVSGSNGIKNGQYFEQKDIDAHLDALEKKYKGGEETLKEKI